MENKDRPFSPLACGWSCDHDVYTCADKLAVMVGKGSPVRRKETNQSSSEGLEPKGIINLANGIELGKNKEELCKNCSVTISGVTLNRNMEEITKCWNDAVTIAFPRSIRRVADATFKDMQSLRAVSLNVGLRTLGKNVFASCFRLKSLWLPEGLERLGVACFEASGLETVAVPASVTEIEDSAFRHCLALRSVMFQEDSKIRSIGANAFTGTALTRFVAPASLRSIGGAAFCGCEKLASVKLNAGIQKIGLFCFSGTCVKTVALPETITMNPDELGLGCNYTKVIVLPECAERVQSCDVETGGATAVVVPRGVRELGEFLFRESPALRWLVFQSGCALEKIGFQCFRFAGIEEFVAPVSLRAIDRGAFSSCSNLRRVVLNDGLDVLGADDQQPEEEERLGVFQDSSVEEVVLPPALRRLRYATFARCQNLKNTVLPEHLEVIEEYCFFGTGLKEIAIPDSVTEIQAQCFQNCEELMQVSFGLGSRLELLGPGAFAYAKVETFVAPSSLKTIAQGAFYHCTNLSRVVLNYGLKALGNVEPPEGDATWPGVFQESSVQEVVLPLTLEKIEGSAFYDCGRLRRLVFADDREQVQHKQPQESEAEQAVIPNHASSEHRDLKSTTLGENSALREIGQYAFGSTDLEVFVAPPSLETIRQGAFSKCESLRRVVLNEGLEVLGTNEFHNDGSEWRGVFQENAVEEMTLPSTLKRIEYSAFMGCKDLRQLSLPEGLETIGNSCFMTSGIERITLPDSLVEIREKAFYECENLRLVTCGQNSKLQNIGCQAFFKSGLVTFTAPFSLRTISQGAFSKCPELRSVELNEGLQVLGTHQYQPNGEENWGVFEESAIEEIKFPSTLREIEYNAFRECTNLKTVKLPDSLETLGTGAFRHSGLEEFIATPALKTIAQSAFCGCENLKRVELNEGLEVLGTDQNLQNELRYYGVFENSAVEEVKLPSTLKVIQECTFKRCFNLTHLTLPAKLEKIKSYAFAGSGLNSIQITEKITEICSYAFYRCFALASVNFVENCQLEKIGNHAFKETALECFVPPSSLREIGSAVFCGCRRLAYIAPCNNIQRVGWFCFSATALTQWTSRQEVVHSGINLGFGCDYVGILALPEGLEEIRDQCEHATGADVVVIPASAKRICKEAFYGLRRLRRVVFQPGSRLEVIEVESFKRCHLEEISLPKSLVEIEAGAFYGCEKLRVVTFEEGCALRQVGKGAFAETPLRPEDVYFPKDANVAKAFGSYGAAGCK